MNLSNQSRALCSAAANSDSFHEPPHIPAPFHPRRCRVHALPQSPFLIDTNRYSHFTIPPTPIRVASYFVRKEFGPAASRLKPDAILLSPSFDSQVSLDSVRLSPAASVFQSFHFLPVDAVATSRKPTSVLPAERHCPGLEFLVNHRKHSSETHSNRHTIVDSNRHPMPTSFPWRSQVKMSAFPLTP